MKRNILFLLIIILISAVIIIYLWIADDSSNSVQNPFDTSPRPTQFVFSPLTPPSQSLRANIVTRSGEILWQSRIATEPATLAAFEYLKQGERVQTGIDGSLLFEFPGIAKANVDPSSDVALIQAVANNIVFTQRSGKVIYSRSGAIPLSVRIFHLLADLEVGEVEIIIDPVTSLLSITPTHGAATVAFNDLDFVSQVVTIHSGDVFLYDDLSRTYEIN